MSAAHGVHGIPRVCGAAAVMPGPVPGLLWRLLVCRHGQCRADSRGTSGREGFPAPASAGMQLEGTPHACATHYWAHHAQTVKGGRPCTGRSMGDLLALCHMQHQEEGKFAFP